VPTILMTRTIEDVPFDYRHRRCIVYDTSQAGWETKLKSDLRNTIEAALGSNDPASDLSWPYDTTAIQRLPPRGQLVEATEGLAGIVRGAQLVRDVVERAIGPAGRRVSVRNARGNQTSSRNGAVLAPSVQTSDPMMAIGVEEMKRVVAEIQSSVGDGTKTAGILASEMLAVAATVLQNGMAIEGLVRGMDRAVHAALGTIESEARPVTGAQLRQVAQTAAQAADIGALVVDAFERVGKYGVVTVEKTVGPSSIEVNQGIQIDRGFLSEAFVTSPRTAECALEEPLILLCEFKLTSLREVLPLLEEVARAGRQLLIVAEDVEGEALSTLIVNQRRGTLKVCAIKSPGFGDRRRHLLEDLATLTGAVAFTSDGGRSLASARLTDLGSSRMIVATRSQTTILEGRGKPDAIEQRVEYIKAELKGVVDLVEREKLQERLANIGGAVAVIRSGGVTPAEASDRSVTIANAMHACQAAVQSGWVPGGGWTAANAAKTVRALESLDPTDRAAHRCIAQPLEALSRNLPVLMDSSTDGDLAAARQRIEAAGVLDATLLLSRGLSVAWSHVRAVIQTGAWDVAAIPPTAEDTE
jgi:chaperonin GroEL